MVMMKIIVSVILLFVGIGVLVSIHLCVVGRAFRRGFGIQGGGGGDDDQGIIHRAMSSTACGLTAEDLKMIPWFNYKEAEKGGGSAVDCAVCLDGFKAGDQCRLVPGCHHCFHLECVDLWLMKKPFCPTCRASVRPTNKSVADDQIHGPGPGADGVV